MIEVSEKQLHEIYDLTKRFPRSLSVHANRSEDGGFYATVKNLPGVVTEGDSFAELMDMVNDAVYAYFEVPEMYVQYMPSYSPHAALAAEIDFIPGRKMVNDFELSLALSEED